MTTQLAPRGGGHPSLTKPRTLHSPEAFVRCVVVDPRANHNATDCACPPACPCRVWEFLLGSPLDEGGDPPPPSPNSPVVELTGGESHRETPLRRCMTCASKCCGRDTALPLGKAALPFGLGLLRGG